MKVCETSVLFLFNKQGKLIVACSPECYGKNFEEGAPGSNFAKDFRKNLQEIQNREKQSQTIQQPASSQSLNQNQNLTEPKSNYLPWIIGGTAFFLVVIGIIFLLFKKENK
jgi:hypothetical protein